MNIIMLEKLFSRQKTDILEMEIKKELIKAFNDIYNKKNAVNFDIQYPPQEKFGHFSSNLAMKVSPILNMPPQTIAEKIISQIKDKSFFKDNFSKIEVAPPAFINFYLSPKCLSQSLNKIIKAKEKYGHSNIGKNEKIQLEFISANPTGEPTIGNARGAFLGDVLANVLKEAGFNIWREYYVNNAKNSRQIKELGKTALKQGETYSTPHLQELIKDLSYTGTNEGEAGYLLSQKIIKETKDYLEKELNIKFDKWFKEEELYKHKEIQKTFKLLEKTGNTYKKENATWLKTSNFGDDEDRVLVRSDGEPSYFLSDITYHLNKFNRGFEKVINIWGADHQSHIVRMKAALKILGLNPDKLDVIIVQLMNLRQNGEVLKLSKRKGVVITLKELVDLIGLDASRYFFISTSADHQMTFDMEIIKKQSEENPFFYMQYAYVRTGSILKKYDKKVGKTDLSILKASEEINLICGLNKLPYIISRISNDYQVQQLNQLGLEISQKFHNFYEKHKVIGEDKELTQARLNLVMATRIVLKKIFNLMGISAPEKM
jgi:arginyl-tRNA synthetase